MFSTIRKRLFGIILAIFAVAFAILVSLHYGNAILSEYNETQRVHEIRDVRNHNIVDSENSNTNEKALLNQGYNLYKVLQKNKNFEFKLSNHRDVVDSLKKDIHNHLAAYYEKAYDSVITDIESFDFEDAYKAIDANEKTNDDSSNDESYDDETDDDSYDEESENIINDSVKIIDKVDINLINERKEELSQLITKALASKNNAEKAETDNSDSSKEGSDNIEQTAKAGSNEWQMDFIVTTKKDNNGNPILDTNGNPEFVIDGRFEDIMNTLNNISELSNKLDKNEFITRLNNCSNFSEILNCISKPTDKTTTIRAANQLKSPTKSEIILKESVDKLITSLDSLDKEYVDVICDCIKIKIKENYIDPPNSINDNLEKICNQIISKKDIIQGHPVYTFADKYIKWYKDLKNVKLQFKRALAKTTFPKGIKINKFEIYVHPYCISYDGAEIFKNQDKSFFGYLKSNGNMLNNVELKYCDSIKVHIQYQLENAWVFYPTHTQSKEIHRILYPMLRPKWTITDELTYDKDKPLKTTFTLEIGGRNDKENIPTLQELFDSVFSNETNEEAE